MTKGSRQPLAGVFVVLTDSTGADAARTLSDGGGHFVLRAPRAATYRVAIRSIGWRAWSSSPMALHAGHTVQYTLEYPLRPIMLEEVQVAAVPQCRTDVGAGSRIAELWEKAVRALEVVSWTQRESRLRVRWHRYQRRLHPRTLEVLDEELVAHQGLYAGSPFVSRPAEDLATGGYIRRDSLGDWEFLAPDADALLSDAFVRDHCFHLLADPTGSKVIGLGFQPVREANAVDIEGTLWIDSLTTELKRLEFRYVRLPWRRISSEHVGGRVEFGRLPTGAWIIPRWYIRMPVVRVHWSISDWVSEPRIQLTALREVGGTVWEVRTQEGELVATEGNGMLSGVVYDSTTGRPLAAAGVLLVGTALTTAADAQGRFAFNGLPSSAYQVTFDHPVLDSVLGVELVRSVFVGAGTHSEITLALPPRERMRSALCPGIAPSEAVLGGFIRSTIAGRELTDVVVSVSWRRPTQDSTQIDRRDVTADAAGLYLVCGAPTGVPLSIEVVEGRATRVDVPALLPGSLLRVDIAVAR